MATLTLSLNRAAQAAKLDKQSKAKQPPPPSLTPEQRRERFARKLEKAGTSLSEINKLRNALVERYPAVFDPMHRRALAIGIHKAILTEIDCNPFALHMVLRDWCVHPLYLTVLVTGRHRHDLQGNDVAEITEAERVNARQSLAAIRARTIELRRIQRPKFHDAR
jgi:ProQ/FINO family